MKEKYEVPRLEILYFEKEDIIVTSGEGSRGFFEDELEPDP